MSTGLIFNLTVCSIGRQELLLNDEFADRYAVPAELLEHVGDTTALSVDALSINLVLVDQHVLHSLGTAIGQTDVVVLGTLGRSITLDVNSGSGVVLEVHGNALNIGLLVSSDVGLVNLEVNEDVHVLSALVNNLSLGLGSLAGSIQIALELSVACVSSVEVTLQAIELAAQTVDLTIQSIDVILAVLVGAEGHVVLAIATLEVIGDTSLELNSSVVSIHLALAIAGLAVPLSAGVGVVTIGHHDVAVHVPNNAGLQAEGPSAVCTEVEVEVCTSLGVPAVVVVAIDVSRLCAMESVQPTSTDNTLKLKYAGLALVTTEEVAQVNGTKQTGHGVVDDVRALGSPVVGLLGPAGGVDGSLTLSAQTEDRSELLADLQTEDTTSAGPECITLEGHDSTTLQGYRPVVKELVLLERLSLSSKHAHQKG